MFSYTQAESNAMKLLLALLCLTGMVHANCDSDDRGEKRGYWWYHDCAKTTALESVTHPDPGPLPAATEMLNMHPKDLEKLLENRKEWALYKATPETVRDYYVVQDIVRRKAVAFTALTKYVMMTSPELNSRSQYPIVAPARKVATQIHDQQLEATINTERNHYALAFFTTERCAYCTVQRSTLKYFQDTHAWDIKEIDIGQNPIAATRFNVTTTPMTIIVERGSERWMPVSVGVESLPDIQSGVYRAIRMLRGEISPRQYLLEPDEEGGFFDPTAVPGDKPK
jgi:conjugal transfer pilus assembly protein TraF